MTVDAERVAVQLWFAHRVFGYLLLGRLIWGGLLETSALTVRVDTDCCRPIDSRIHTLKRSDGVAVAIPLVWRINAGGQCCDPPLHVSSIGSTDPVVHRAAFGAIRLSCTRVCQRSQYQSIICLVFSLTYDRTSR